MIISHEHRFVFVRTKKTASTSMEIALSRFTGPDDIVPIDIEDGEELSRKAGSATGQNSRVPRKYWRLKEWARWAAGKPDIHFHNHMPAAEIRRYIGRLWDDYFTLTVDRNPWDLAVSAYCWRSARFPEEWPDFDAFVLGSRLPKYSNWDRYAIDGQIAVDQIIPYSQLADALPGLSAQLGIPTLELPNAKASYRGNKGPYQDWYNDQTRGRVAEVFHREIETFGWTFD